MAKRTTLVVLAAGMGSRYGGVKQIDGVGPNGEAIIDYSIYDALRAGFTDLCFVVRAEIEEAVREFLSSKFPRGTPVRYAVQSLDDLPGGFRSPAGRAKPWGTAHAVYAARTSVDTPFAAINADDFYGRDSYRQLHAFLTRVPSNGTEYSMVGYRLAETLSPNGTVSRGICRTDAEGYLVGIEEHKKIEGLGSSVYDTLEDGTNVEFAPDDVVSMNMFGFTPTVFAHIERELAAFLAGSIEKPGAEFYIPTLMARLITAGSARMKVLPTSSRWFGMTYREDRPEVQTHIRSLVERGEYPRKLWE